MKPFSKIVSIYIAVSFFLTFLIDAFIIHRRASVYEETLLVSLRMCMPGLTAIVLSLLSKDKTFWVLIKRLPTVKQVVIAYLFPVIFGFISVFIFCLLQGSTCGPRSELITNYGGLRPFLFKALVYAPTIGFVFPFLTSLGEEIGWRGFLYPKTANLGPFSRKFLNGCVWAVWHWPIIIFADYANAGNKVTSLIAFSLMIIFSSFLMCWLQDKSRSLWTSAIFHAAHNLWVIGILPAFYEKTETSSFLVGESGLLLVSSYLIGISLTFYLEERRLPGKALPPH